MFKAICKLGLEGIFSKKLDAPYRSGPSKTWIKIKNPKATAATRRASTKSQKRLIVCPCVSFSVAKFCA
jgi:bifunctional non-homologous end joining protein LigD